MIDKSVNFCDIINYLSNFAIEKFEWPNHKWTNEPQWSNDDG